MFYGLVFGLLLLGSVIDISLNSVYAQCFENHCLPSTHNTKKLYENNDPYEIKQLTLRNYDEQGNYLGFTVLDQNNKISIWKKNYLR